MNDDKVLNTIARQGGQYACYRSTAAGDERLYTNVAADTRFLSASLIKIPILLAWVMLERRGEVNGNELCNLDDEPQVQGAGFSWLLRERRLPFADVLLLMIALSDNLCTNLVIRRVGLERLNEVFRGELGLQGTVIERKLMDYEARARGLDNWITPQDCIRFFALIHGLPSAERVWVDSLFAVNQDDLYLMRDIERDSIVFHHKTGSIPGVMHDWGYTADRNIFLITQAIKDEPAVYPVFGAVGRWLMGEG